VIAHVTPSEFPVLLVILSVGVGVGIGIGAAWALRALRGRRSGR
jgi:hypothetical protein